MKEFLLTKTFKDGGTEAEIYYAMSYNDIIKTICPLVDNWREVLLKEKEPIEVVENYLQDTYTMYVCGVKELLCDKIMLYEKEDGKTVECYDLLPVLENLVKELKNWLKQ